MYSDHKSLLRLLRLISLLEQVHQVRACFLQEQVETADKALAAQLEAEKAQPRAKQQRDRRAPEGAAARHALKLQQHTDGYPAKDAQQKDKEKVCTHLCVCVCVCLCVCVCEQP